MNLTPQQRATLAEAEHFMRQVRNEIPAADRQKMAESQARFDSIAAQLGIDGASDPIPGESANSYRGRLLERLAARTEKFKNSRFSRMDAAMIDLGEELVAEALQVTVRHDAVGAGRLVPIQYRDPAGRTITRYEGDIGAFMAPFMSEGYTQNTAHIHGLVSGANAAKAK